VHEDQYTSSIISRSFLLRKRNVSDGSYREYQSIYNRILCSVTFFRKIVPFMR